MASNVSGKSTLITTVNEEKERVYKKLKKMLDILINSDITIVSDKINIFDLIVHNPAEYILLTNQRVRKLNEEIQEANQLYKKLKK